MKYRVRMFAVARQLAAAEVVEVELPEGSRLGDLRATLAEQVPSLAAILPQVMFAIGSDYARDDAVLSPECQIACIPPVSGG